MYLFLAKGWELCGVIGRRHAHRHCACRRPITSHNSQPRARKRYTGVIPTSSENYACHFTPYMGNRRAPSRASVSEKRRRVSKTLD